MSELGKLQEGAESFMSIPVSEYEALCARAEKDKRDLESSIEHANKGWNGKTAAESELDGVKAALKACCDDAVVAADYARKAAGEVARLTARGDLWKGAHKKAEERYVRDEASITRIEALLGRWRSAPVAKLGTPGWADELESALTPEEAS